MEPLRITCATCQTRLRIRSPEAIGQVHECPKCHSMVHVTPPPDWRRPVAAADPPSAPADPTTADLSSDTSGPGSDLARASTTERLWWRPAVWVGLTGLSLVVTGGLAILGWTNTERAAVRQPSPRRALRVPNTATAGDQAGAAAPASDASREARPNTPRQSPSAQATVASDTADREPAATPPPLEPPATAADRHAPPGASTSAKRKPGPETDPTVDEPPPDATPAPSAEQRQRPVTTVISELVEETADRLPPVDVRARLADTVPQIDFADIPLVGLIDFLVQLTRVPITLDPDALARSGKAATDRISIQAQDQTIATVLSNALAQVDLSYAADDRHILVTLPGPSISTVRYRVDDLLAGSAADDSVSRPLEELAGQIRRFIAPTSWHARGGRGTIERQDGALHIYQSPAIHYRILVFCERLRLARGLPTRSRLPVARFDLASRRARMRETLDRHVTCTFLEPTSLVQLVRHLRQAMGVVLAIDWRQLIGQGFTPDARITCAVVDQPLGEALTALLKPIGLGWYATDSGAIQITTWADVEQRLDLEFYRVTRASNGTYDPQPLIAALRRSVVPNSWHAAGGAGTVVYDPAASHLIVRQTQPVQVEVQRWLNRRWPTAKAP